MKIVIVVPTFHRAQHLGRCLDALVRQTRPADQIIVVVRAGDIAAERVVDTRNSSLISMVRVEKPGVAAAYNVGLKAAAGDIVAFTDDDAEPEADWVARLLDAYADCPEIAGVGGRDILPTASIAAPIVGRMQWFGRTIGNHHRGVGPPRMVDILKGVNMSFRSSAIDGLRFEEDLRGSGAQVGVELGFCLALRRLGGSLLYDPAIAVRHDPAPRADADQRARFVAESFTDAVHNLTYLTLKHLPPARHRIFLAFGFLIGTRGEPGAAQLVRSLLERDPDARAKFIAAWRGRVSGLRHFRRSKIARAAIDRYV